MEGAYYNSDLEQQLLQSLTVREGHQRAREAPKNVRFDEGIPHRERTSRKHTRDSQRSRESPGLPGSRRHNRHQNKMELLDKALSDSESELEIEVELVVTFKSPFKVLFDDPECKKRWEPFVEITEQEEKQLLDMLYAEPENHSYSKKKHALPTDPAECWRSLTRDEKRIMRKQAGNPLIEKIEDLLIGFILSRKLTKQLVFTQENRFERILFNCCCVYYSVHVQGWHLEDGSTSETIKKPKGIQLPSMKFSEYLKTLSADPQQ